eukprot:Em0002g1415a
MALSCSGSNCTTHFSAGAVWPASAGNTTVYQACSNIDHTSFLRDLQASRYCSSNGTWGDVDLTTCALLPGTAQSFALVWIVFNGSSLNASSLNAIETRGSIACKSSVRVTRCSPDVACEDFFQSFQPNTGSSITLSFRLDLNITSMAPSEVANVSQRVDMLVTRTVSFGLYTFLPNGKGYQLIVLSDSCQCTPSGRVVLLCVAVTQPCLCTRQGSCRCLSPFVGDGVHCTGDYDGDGFPAMPLDTCIPNNTAKYCIQATPQLFNSLANMATFTSTLVSLTSPSQTSLQPLDLNTTNFLVRSIVDQIERVNSNNTTATLGTLDQGLLTLFNNLISSRNTYGWLDLQQVGTGSPVLLTNVERFGGLLSRMMTKSSSRVIYGMSNYVLATERVSVVQGQSYLFPSSLNDLANSSFSSISAQIKIPYGYLLKQLGGANSTVPVTTAVYATLDGVLPVNSSDTSIASVVISAQVSQQGNTSTASTSTTTPITLTFTVNTSAYSTGATYQCVFWNAVDDLGNGHWATTGLTLVRQNATSNGMMTLECESTHLTSFAILVDVSGTLTSDDSNSTGISTSELEGLEIASYIGCGVSVVSLLLAGCFLLLLGKSLLVEVQYFIHLNLSLALLAVYIIFVAGIETARTNEGACIFVAAILHYFLLASFSWMLCEGVMLFVLLVLVFRKRSAKWWYFFIFGWGAPAVVVAISVGTSYNYYGIRDSDGNLNFCWLSIKRGVIWAFVAPILIFIVANVIFLAIALFVMLRLTYRKAFIQDELSTWKASRRLLRTLLVSTSILLPVLGIAWAFGILAVNVNTTVFAWLFTIFNSFQGALIFFFHVLQNPVLLKKLFPKCVRRQSAKKEARSGNVLPPPNIVLNLRSTESSAHNTTSDMLLDTLATAVPLNVKKTPPAVQIDSC